MFYLVSIKIVLSIFLKTEIVLSIFLKTVFKIITEKV